ncbi:MAG: DUF4403 family protein, partial [Bacteroidota bacterium]|nr:DUF4403 family protein [Bacteroidota bacterium]
MLLILGINACKTLKPQKPEEAYPHLKSQENISTVNIPIEFPITELEKQINKQVAGLIYENGGKKAGNENLEFKVWKKQDISVEGKDGMFHFKVPLKVWVKADLGLQKMGINISESKETYFEIDLNFISGLSVDSNYNVVPDIHANGYDWVRRPKLKMGFIEISLGSFVEPYIQEAQQQISKNINEQIKDKIDIKKWVQNAWNGLQQPMLISEEHHAWINIKPLEIHMTPIHVHESKVNAIIGFKAITETVFGDKPQIKELSTLPPLQIAESVQDDFAITFSGEISQEKARNIIAEKFVGKEFSFKGGKKKVTITKIDLYGSEGDLIVEADLVGSIDGKIFLSGKPHYD